MANNFRLLGYAEPYTGSYVFFLKNEKNGVIGTVKGAVNPWSGYSDSYDGESEAEMGEFCPLTEEDKTIPFFPANDGIIVHRECAERYDAFVTESGGVAFAAEFCRVERHWWDSFYLNNLFFNEEVEVLLFV